MLPLEVLVNILLELDIPSLTVFRCLNHRARDLVDSLYQYASILKHCPDVLRAIISIHAAHFPCHELYITLSTTQCDTCNRVGGYLYLITCKRVCYHCFTADLKCFPISATYAARRTGMSRKRLGNLPSVRSLLGRYTGFAELSRTRIMLLDRESVREIVPETTFQSFSPPRDLTTTEPRRFMCIVTASFLIGAGQEAD
ncbi:hypothetical protein S40285_08138 [Stachybotrys chlorohalonatus IBT 40285]|uniref:F-box domain-containing protein n=1 Tax=Stachybotrys chlorohalonatus (strain IBT 40285) TaxID=1283841 RepID=A0A084QQ49_STAC4|nr:hypothetical protein S40285_08138 [Stachybotrys chlorohalonata IBT 40285]